ncbi:MAG: HlyD family secretion protein [Hyphomicrobium sp.]
MRKIFHLFRFLFVFGVIVALGFLVKFVISSSTSLLSNASSSSSSEASAQAASTANPQVANPVAAPSASSSPKNMWAASATGRVEPKEGEIRIISQSAGEIMEVIGKSGDRVVAGDLIVRLDDSDLQAKLVSARAEEAVRILERNEDPEKNSLALDRRKAEDAVADADRYVFNAQIAFDEVARKVRSGNSNADDLAAARKTINNARKKLDDAKLALDKLSSSEDMPLPSRLESSLTQARSDVVQIENAIERTRIRAPSDGTILNVWAKLGEVVVSSPDAPLVLLGDLSSMRVRTEVEERDVVKVRIGQKAIIKADAYPGQEFTGVVTSIAPALGAQRIISRGPRRPNDIEVLEVMVVLDGQSSLLTGMRVDVFFKADQETS